jgi:hypothetical protein
MTILFGSIVPTCLDCYGTLPRAPPGFVDADQMGAVESFGERVALTGIEIHAA